MRCHKGSLGGVGGLNRLRLAFERVALTVLGGVRRRVLLLALDEVSTGALERLFGRLGGADVLEVASVRFRRRGVPSGEEMLERADLEPLREDLFERLFLSELTAPPHRCQLCRHCAQDSRCQLVFQSKLDPTGGSVQVAGGDSLPEPYDNHFAHFPWLLWFR